MTSNTSALPTRAGVRQGLIGSLILVGFVAIVRRSRSAARRRSTSRSTRGTPGSIASLIANIRNLAGVPSVVFGILGLIVFAQTLRSVTGPGDGKPGLSYLSGGLTIAILVMPIVILDLDGGAAGGAASIREAAYGVGATRWEVVRSHVLPYAAPGMFTGVILAMARAFGETAPLLLVGADDRVLQHTQRARASSRSSRGLHGAAHPDLLVREAARRRRSGRITSAAIVVLLVAILAVNAIAILLRNRYERKW